MEKHYHVIGVMSGTSLDGIDLAEIFFVFSEKEGWHFEFGITETVAYPSNWKDQLKLAITKSKDALDTLNEAYTIYLAEVISDFIQKNSITNLDAVCSHGHTILHRPDQGITLQIGNLPNLASLINQKVVCNFRVADVALGGQGAPLVPIGDRLLFNQYDYCLNLGGFANCSFETEENRIAYDICPVNIVLNALTERLGLPYDDKGKIAESGGFSLTLSESLRSLSYYKEIPPKSLGLEWVHANIQPLLDETNITIKDQLRTLTDHFGNQIGKQFKKGSTVLITGGGAYNEYLLKRITFNKDVETVVPSPQLIEYKEALIFALLGVLKLRDEVNCLASVTGASRDHSSGLVFNHN
jgi:anhydro-N-acetylmuramic acid kinase